MFLAIDTAAQVLGELAENMAVDHCARLVRIECYLERRICGMGRDSQH